MDRLLAHLFHFVLFLATQRDLKACVLSMGQLCGYYASLFSGQVFVKAGPAASIYDDDYQPFHSELGTRISE